MIDHHENFITFSSSIGVKYKSFQKDIFLKYVKANSDLSKQFQRLRESKLTLEKKDFKEDSETFLFYKEIDFEDLVPLKISLENLRFTLKISDEINQIQNASNPNETFCNKTIYTEIKIPKTDISSALTGTYRKDLNLVLGLLVKCPISKNTVSALFKSVKLASILVVSYFSNYFLSFLVSFFYYKDILDTPHMIRKKYSPKFQDLISLFQSFGCDQGFTTSEDKDSFESFQEISSYFMVNQKRDYDSKEKTAYFDKNTDFIKNLGECRAVLVYSEVFCICLFTAVGMFLFVLKLVKHFTNRDFPKCRKILNAVNKMGMFFVVIVYFENFISFLNLIKNIKVQIFGFRDFTLIIVRTCLLFLPLKHLQKMGQDQKSESKIETKNTEKIPSKRKSKIHRLLRQEILSKIEEEQDKKDKNTETNTQKQKEAIEYLQKITRQEKSKTFKVTFKNKRPSQLKNLFKNLIIILFVFVFNARPVVWVLSTSFVQIVYVIFLFSRYTVYNRKNWSIFFQEVYFLIYICLDLEFIFATDDEYYEVHFMLYFIGNMSSIFFICFEVFDSLFQNYRVSNQGESKKKNGSILRRRKSKRTKSRSKKSQLLKKYAGKVLDKLSKSKELANSKMKKNSTNIVGKSKFYTFSKKSSPK